MCATDASATSPAPNSRAGITSPRSLYECEEACEADDDCDAFLSHPFGVENTQAPIDYCEFYKDVTAVTVEPHWNGHGCWSKSFTPARQYFAREGMCATYDG